MILHPCHRDPRRQAPTGERWFQVAGLFAKIRVRKDSEAITHGFTSLKVGAFAGWAGRFALPGRSTAFGFPFRRRRDWNRMNRGGVR